MIKSKDVKALLERVESVTKQKEMDLSSGEDLSIAVMNLISIEEHLFFTSQKTGKQQYLDLLNQIRLMRTNLLREIIKDYEGEIWCVSKHLLAASMRLMEVGTKKLKSGDQKSAQSLFEKSYKLYTLFWGLNLSNSPISKTSHFSHITFLDERDNKNVSSSVFDKLGNIIQKALDCCRE